MKGEASIAQKEKKMRTSNIIKLLEEEYPTAGTALDYSNPLELLVATILSAQCTDRMVNRVVRTLFKKYKTAEDYASSDLTELEENIRSTGFYKNKARNIKRACQILVDKFDSQLPRTMDEMIELPGVGRKTANIVLSNGFGIVEGIAVDTHVRRTARRLGLTGNDDPNRIEQDLMKIVPKEKWMRITDLLIFLGRDVCTARVPKCGRCRMNRVCPSAFTFAKDGHSEVHS